jgi:pilus assembly protein Flp/PilA
MGPRNQSDSVVEGDTYDDTLLSVLPPQEEGLGKTQMERTAMKFELWKIYTALQHLMAREEGQDLVEYALLIGMITLAATATMQGLAVDVNSFFGVLGNTLTSATT